MIELINVSKNYSNNPAVKNVSLKIEKGQIVGLLGPNGAGKTTIMRMITGSLSTTSGNIKAGGFDVLESPIQCKRLIGYLPENPPLYSEMTVAEYLNFAGKLKGLPPSLLKTRMGETIQSFNLQDVSKKIINNLSKGYKQRLGIAAALIHRPPILILDEPTIGLDPKQIIEIRQLIKSLSTEHTILLSTHILQEVTAICSKVIIIHKGQIVAEDSHDNLEKKVLQGLRITVTLKNPPEDKIFRQKIETISGVKKIISISETSYIIETGLDDPRDRIAEKIANEKWGLLELKLIKMSLEDIFLELTYRKDLN